jgi:hypothetical protein
MSAANFLRKLNFSTLIFPKAVAVLPKSLNPNVKAFLSIHKELFESCTPGDIELQRVERLVVVDAKFLQGPLRFAA